MYDNKNITRNQVVGVDFNTGSFNHSIRFEYLKFQNQIVDATVGSSLPLANYPLEIQMGSTGLVTGPNYSHRKARCKAIIRSNTTEANPWVRMSFATVSVLTILWVEGLRTSKVLRLT